MREEYDGRLASLIDHYQTDEISGYRALREPTRKNYDRLLRRIRQDCGTTVIADIKTRTLRVWHLAWSADGKHLPMAHSLMAMLRTLATYGVVLLEDDACKMLKVTLNGQRFPQGKQREEFLRTDQVDAIRAKAHEMGWPSIALAQALQFEGTMRQKDIIGEWVSIGEPGTSDVRHERWGKWHRGLRWNEIDENLILRHVTSKRQKEIVVDLKLAPMVMGELLRLWPYLERTDEYTGAHYELDRTALPATGPVIIFEKSGIPFLDSQFRKLWRVVATAAGVPARILNMDTRSGAISEALAAGVPIEMVRHAAAHSDIAMTTRYSRAGQEATATAMQARAANRKQSA